MDMEQNRITLNNLLLMYCLLEATSTVSEDTVVPCGGFVDFDDVKGFYTHGFEVLNCDLSNKGLVLGLLHKYEDELYSVDEDKWYFLQKQLDIALYSRHTLFNSHRIHR